MVHVRSPELLDYVLVESTKVDMHKKLYEKRLEGKTGWQRRHFDDKLLMEMLIKNLKKGDMVDVINLAAMLHQRQVLYGGDIPEANL